MSNKKANKFIEQSCSEAITEIDKIQDLANDVLFVTGCGGFVGRWVLEFVLYLNTERGFNIKVYATTRLWDLENPDLVHLIAHDNFYFSEIDVRSEFNIPIDVNKVIHLAGSPDPKEIVSDPLKVIDTIVKGTSNLLDAVNDHGGIGKTLNFTSGYVDPALTIGGDGQTNYAFNTTADLMSVYSESKRMSEVLCNVYRRRFHLSIINVRPYSFFGPFMDLNKVWAINNFYLDALNGNPISITGNKQTVRSYMYPADMVFQVMKLLIVEEEIPYFELGSTQKVTLGQLAENIAQLFGLPQKYFSNEVLVESQEKVSVFVPSNNSYAFNTLQSDHSTLVQSLAKTKAWMELK